MSARPTGAVRPRLAAVSFCLLLAGIVSLPLLPAGEAVAAEPGAAARRSYAIDAGPLGDVLAQFAARAGVRLSFDPALVAGRQSAGLHGEFSVEEGFARILAGSGHALDRLETGVYSLRRLPPAAGREAQLAPVTVTASGDPGPGGLPLPYAGGQVARGARLGVLGNIEVMDAPFNVTAYTAQTIVDQQSTTVAEVLRNDPSVRYTTPDGHNAENFTIRGFEINSSELAFNGLYGLLPGAHVPTEFLERIEVFKGPAAMLSGISPSGAVGGVINLVPKRATEAPVTRLGASLVSDSRLGLSADVGRRFGPEQRFGARFNAAWSDGETTLDDQEKGERFAALALDWRGDRWRLELDAYYAHQEQSDGSPLMVSFATLGRVLSAPDPRKNALRGTYADQDTKGAVLRAEVDLNDRWTAHAALGAARYEYKGYINGTRVVVLNDAGNARGQTYHQAGYSQGITAEAGVRGVFETGPVTHRLAASVSSLRVRSGLGAVGNSPTYVTNIYQPIPDPLLAGAPGKVNTTADNDYTSVSLADTLSFLDERVLLTLGARQQRVQQKMATPKPYDEDALTPLVGLVVKPWGPHVSLYGNYIEGLSPGVTVGTAFANAGETLSPYETKQSELGVKWESGSFTNTFSLFRIERPFTVSVPTGGLPRLELGGEQLNRGLEWNIFGELARNVRILGGAAYTQARQEKAAIAANQGKDVAGVPRWTVNLGGEWDTPWLPGLTLSTRLTYTGTQYLEPANRLELPAWTRWDLGARYATRIAGRQTVIRASVENVADRHYWAGRFNDGFANIASPRTFKLSASVDF